jgi:hypothetical protein
VPSYLNESIKSLNATEEITKKFREWIMSSIKSSFFFRDICPAPFTKQEVEMLLQKGILQYQLKRQQGSE